MDQCGHSDGELGAQTQALDPLLPARPPTKLGSGHRETRGKSMPHPEKKDLVYTPV